MLTPQPMQQTHTHSCRQRCHRFLVATLLCLALAGPVRCQESVMVTYPAGFGCADISLAAQGADTTGTADVGPVLANYSSVQNWAVPGIIFVTPGRYAVRSNTDIFKPVTIESGAVFEVAAGVTLRFIQFVSAGAYQIFSGPGTVQLLRHPGAILPEWFGAKGDNVTDDSDAINRAMKCSDYSNAELLFGSKTYAIASSVNKLVNARVNSQPGATLMATTTGVTGIVYQGGGHVRPDQLPALVGFEVGIRYDDIGMVDNYAPLIMGTPELPCGTALQLNTDSARLKFGTILNCKRGIHIIGPSGVVMQGFTVEGNEFIDTTGVATDVILFESPSILRPPYWDHGNYMIRRVLPSQLAKNFAFIRTTPMYKDVSIPMCNFDVPTEFGALPPGGKLIDAYMWDCVIRITPTGGFKDGQLDYVAAAGTKGFNSLYFNGRAARLTKILRLQTQPNTMAAFKKANSLANLPYNNLLSVTLPQNTTVWKTGEMRRFYLYHQLAYDGQLHFMTVPGAGASCVANNSVFVAGLSDKSMISPYEIVLTAVACKDIPLTQKLTLQLSVGALGA